MRLKHVGIVFRKELLSAVRDRRTLLVSIVLPLILMPLFVVGPTFLFSTQEAQKQEQVQRVALLNASDAPDLVDLIRQSGQLMIVDLPGSEGPREAVRDKKIAAALVLPKSFREMISQEAPPPAIAIQYDLSNSDSRTARDKLSELLGTYRQQLVGERLKQRNLSPQLLEPFAIQTENVAPPERLSGFLSGFFLIFYLVLAAAIGGLNIAIDVTAGEKERGTLEALLVTPPARTSLVVGKFLAVGTGTLLYTVLTLFALALSLELGQRLMPDNQLFGNPGFLVQPGALALLFGVMALLAAMMSALIFALSAWTRNFKEAQTYSTYISFVVMIPALLVAFMDVPTSLSAFLIPVYNSAATLKELIMGEANWNHLAATFLSSAVYAIISLMLAVRVFENERVLFRQ